MPRSSKPWLPESATECTASASVAVEPLTMAATNLHAAIATLPASAAMTTLRLPSAAMRPHTLNHSVMQAKSDARARCKSTST